MIDNSKANYIIIETIGDLQMIIGTTQYKNFRFDKPIRAHINGTKQEKLTLVGVNNKVEKLSSVVDKLIGVVSTLAKEVDILKNQVSVLRQEVSDLRQEVSTLRQEVSDLRQEVSTLRQEVSDLRQEVNDLRIEMRQGFAQINARIDNLVRKNNLFE